MARHPIETAKLDGSLVFVTDDTGTVAKAVWTGHMWAYHGCDWEQIDFDPTGWVDKPSDIFATDN